MVLHAVICYHAIAATGLRDLTMRIPLLLLAAGCLFLPLGFANQTPNPKQVEIDEQKLKDANVNTDGPSLVAFLKSRTLTEDERQRVDALISQLGASSFKVREQASQELIDKGPVVLELLRQGLNHPEEEVQRRCEACIQRIKDNDRFPDLPASAVRLLGIRQPAGAVEVLLGYLPFVDSESVADDVRDVLTKVALVGGKVDKALTGALTDRIPARRAAAGQAVILGGACDGHAKAIQQLLQDPDVMVRWRVATALVMNKDKDAIPVLIDLLPEIARYQAWQIEDILYRVAERKSPPSVSLGNDDASRQKCRDAWRDWWKEHGTSVDLAVLRQSPRLLGRTTMVLLDVGKVIEVEGDSLRWQIDNLEFPLDIQVLGDDRILVAEYYGNKVTERDFKGQILWKYEVPEPQMAQRLPNGNTFIASKYSLLEVDPKGTKVLLKNLSPANDGIMKCAKCRNGDIVCIFENGRVVRMDSSGSKELSSFRVDIGKALFGGRIEVLPTGGVLIPHHLENKVVEYDSAGKSVWSVKVDQPIVATRLRNGNTLVTSMGESRAVEFDRYGNEVWQYQRTDSRVTRALRR
jgi:HEAT repeat protein